MRRICNISYIRKILSHSLSIFLTISFATKPANNYLANSDTLRPIASILSKMAGGGLPAESIRIEPRKLIDDLYEGHPTASLQITAYVLLFPDPRPFIRTIFDGISKRSDNDMLTKLYEDLISLYEANLHTNVDLAVTIATDTINCIAELARQGFRTAESYLDKLVAEDRDGYCGLRAMVASVSLGKNIHECLAHDNAQVRVAALESLVIDLPREGAEQILLYILRNGDDLEKIYAAWGLGMIKARSAACAQLLSDRLVSSDNISVRRAMAWAMSKMGCDPANLDIDIEPLYDVNNTQEDIDFSRFNPLTASRENGVTIEDLAREARKKMALYPYLSAVYLVQVKGEYVRGTRRRELRGVSPLQIEDKSSYMVVTKKDARSFYDAAATIALMYSPSPSYCRAVVDVDEDQNWYQLKGVGLAINAVFNIPVLWKAPVYTSNTESGLSEANRGSARGLKNDPLAIEEQGGDISRFMAAVRFKTMVDPDGRGFMDAPRWRLRSDDENAEPGWSPMLIPGTHLIFLGKEPRRVNDMLELCMPGAVKVDWILSELGFSKFSHERTSYDDLKSYFSWLAKKIGREIAKVINSGRSHYFLSHMHNTTLSGKLVDFESIQLHEQIEPRDVVDFVRRDIAHVKTMILNLFNSMFVGPLEELYRTLPEQARDRNLDIKIMLARLWSEFEECVSENLDPDKQWLMTAGRIDDPDFTVSPEELNGYADGMEIDPAIGMQIGLSTYILNDQIYEFLTERKAFVQGEPDARIKHLRKSPVSEAEYAVFLAGLMSTNLALYERLEEMGDEGRKQINYILLNQEGTMMIMSVKAMAGAEESDYGLLCFLELLASLREGDEMHTLIIAGPSALVMPGTPQATELLEFCRANGIVIADGSLEEVDWRGFWLYIYENYDEPCVRDFMENVRRLLARSSGCRKMFSAFEALREYAGRLIPKFMAATSHYLERSSRYNLFMPAADRLPLQQGVIRSIDLCA